MTNQSSPIVFTAQKIADLEYGQNSISKGTEVSEEAVFYDVEFNTSSGSIVGHDDILYEGIYRITAMNPYAPSKETGIQKVFCVCSFGVMAYDPILDTAIEEVNSGIQHYQTPTSPDMALVEDEWDSNPTTDATREQLLELATYR